MSNPVIPSWIQGILTGGATSAVTALNNLNNARNNGSLQGAISGFLNYMSGQSDLDAQTAASQTLLNSEQEFNSAEAQKNRDWQEYMSNTAIQRQVKDLEAAGLNPWLALNGGMSGASVGGSSPATSSAGAAGMRSPKWSQLISSAKQLFPSNGLNVGNMFTAAMRIAMIALLA